MIAQVSLSLVTLLLLISFDVAQSRDRVAFVMAGSLRSFLFPYVHKTIQHNLFESFCPPSLCDYDVFMRLSSSDNFHQGLDAAGVHVNGSSQRLQQALAIIKAMDNSERKKFHIKVVDIGSREEHEEMLIGETLRRRIYRLLDSRRYSMYFSRAAAYDMMLEHEKNNNFNYSWAVHSRLDMAWGEPLVSVDHWSTNKIYVPDSWYSDVPDTFALLPRHFSDIFFSLDKHLHEQVACLGGPNFHPDSFTAKYLNSLGFNELEQSIIRNEDCAIRFSQYSVATDHKTKLTWSVGGVSEYMLHRKLKNNGLSVTDKTLDFMPFFVFIVRSNNDMVCFYLHPEHFIPWQKHIHAANAAIFTGCDRYQHHVVSTLRDPNRFPWCSNRSLPPFSQSLPSTTTLSPTLASSTPQQQAMDVIDCLLRSDVSGLNFMPYRIRFRGICLSIVQPTQTSLTSFVNGSECVNYFRGDRYMQTYLGTQLFQLFPKVQNFAQQIYSLSFKDGRKYCLHVSSNLIGRNGRLPVQLQLCESSTASPTYLNQAFYVNLLDDHGDPLAVSDAPLPPTVFAKIRWKSSDGRWYCAYVQPTVLSQSTLVLWPCEPTELHALRTHPTQLTQQSPSQMTMHLGRNASDVKFRGKNGHVFGLEVSKSFGEPHKRGITVGEYPRWR